MSITRELLFSIKILNSCIKVEALSKSEGPGMVSFVALPGVEYIMLKTVYIVPTKPRG